MLEVFTILGWLAVVVGFIILLWEAITTRTLSRIGAALLATGVLLLVLTSVLPLDTPPLHA